MFLFFIVVSLSLILLLFAWINSVLFMNYRFYKKQGLSIDLYYPLIGFFYYQNQGIYLHHNPVYYFNQVIQAEPHKKAIMTNLFSQPLLIFTDPQVIKELVITKYDHFQKATDFFPLGSQILSNGLIFQEGDQWKKQRKIISQAFHFGFLQKTIPYVCEITLENINKIQDLDNVDILVEIQKITGDIITRIFFGKNFSQLKIEGIQITNALADTIEEVFWQQRKIPFLIFGKYYFRFQLTEKDRKIVNRINQFRLLAKETIQERRQNLKGTYDQNPERKDLLQLLLEQEDPQNQLSEKELIGNFITFFFGGTDTTAHLVTALLWFLSKNSDYLEKVKKEIESVFQTQNEIDWNSLQKLTLLEACIKETLRMLPPVQGLFIRKCVEDVELDKIYIKKGTLVTFNILGATLGKGLTNENEFIPERWLNHEMDKVDNFYKIPFSAGPRNCIGQHLAQLEAKIITILFLKKYNYQTICPKELDLTFNPLVGFEPPFKAKLTIKTT